VSPQGELKKNNPPIRYCQKTRKRRAARREADTQKERVAFPIIWVVPSNEKRKEATFLREKKTERARSLRDDGLVLNREDERGGGLLECTEKGGLVGGERTKSQHIYITNWRRKGGFYWGAVTRGSRDRNDV